MREQEAIDVLLGAGIKVVEELEGLLSMVDALNSGGGKDRVPVATALREISSLFDRLPLLQNDLRVIKKRMRKMLSIDPDKTPTGSLFRDTTAKISSPTASSLEDTKFEPVEEAQGAWRKPTRPGIGAPGGPPPLPPVRKREKKD